MLVSATVACIGAAAVSSASAGTTAHRVDLASGALDGHLVYGLTTAQVASLLGRPDFETGAGVIRRIGWGTPGRFSIEVLFRRHGMALRATTVVLESGRLTDPKAGDLLAQTPAHLEATIRTRYAGVFELTKRLSCRSGSCTGVFTGKGSPINITFGSTKARGTFVSLWKPSA
jgi:hypothetical protein